MRRYQPLAVHPGFGDLPHGLKIRTRLANGRHAANDNQIMKPNRINLTLLVIALFGHISARAQDLLPSWNDGPAKQAIADFVRTTTETGGANFVPPEERVATFDQD